MDRERTEFSPPARIHPSGAHLVIYWLEGQGVEIIRSLHAHQKLTAYLISGEDFARRDAAHVRSRLHTRAMRSGNLRRLPAPATKIFRKIKDFKAELNARLSRFQILVNTWSTFYEPPIDGQLDRSGWPASPRNILPKPIHLMHPLVQYRHDADVPVR